MSDSADIEAVQNQPLIGWRILTTRASKQSGGLSQPLRDLGAEVIEVPTIEIKPPASYKPLDTALQKIADYNWLILTSVNGADAVFARLTKLGIPASALSHLQIAAIGPATRKAIEAQGLKVAVTPDKYIAESVVEALRGKTEGKRVLLARAKVARDVLPNELKKAGVKLDVVEAYETMVPAGARAKLQKLFARNSRRPDIVTFTSSSTASNFLDLLGKERQNGLREVWLASIGPVTSNTLRQAGFPPIIEAREYTMQGLVLAITEHVYKASSQQLLQRLLQPE
ncbi:MAG TPA: uroporphyrinogen-III synthase [Candidatus Limnocylindrales bacterium]|nr:uroporphyrinogen-III synthase [Candidatus Limnocylindrales bacterium]